MLYSDQDVRDLYLNIDRLTKLDDTVNLERLQNRLNKTIDFQDKCEKGDILGDILLGSVNKILK